MLVRSSRGLSMMLARLATRCNALPLWRRSVSVWGYKMRACSGDRLLNLCLHRVGLMGRAQERLYQRLLRPGFTVVDVGANQGLYSLLFSGLVGPEGRVYSFEPDPTLFEALATNCERNGAKNIERHNCALGAVAETKTLYRSRVNSGDNRLAASEKPDWFYEVTTRTVTLDSLLNDRRVDFIKIDVQGWELQVVKGMAEVWRKNPGLAVYFEFWPFGLRRAGCQPQELLEWFRDQGFALFDVEGGAPRALVELQVFTDRFGHYESTNILAARPESPALEGFGPMAG